MRGPGSLVVAVAVAITHAHAQHQKNQVCHPINSMDYLYSCIMKIFKDYWWLGLPSPFGGRNYNLEEVCKMFDRFGVVIVVCIWSIPNSPKMHKT